MIHRNQHFTCLSINLLFLIIITVIDYFLGYQISFFVFYFLPIIAVTYFIDRLSGILFSFLSALAWYLADKYSGHVYQSSVIAIWNAGVRLCAFIIISQAFAYIKSLLQKQTQLMELLKKNIEKLNSANRDLNSFNYTVAHDLKNPLIVISGFADILRESEKNLDDEGRGALRKIISESKRMNEIITDLLRLSRIGSHEIELKTVNLSDMASVIVTKLLAVYDGNKYAVIIQPSMSVDADEGLLRILLDNLISNAMKYSSKTDNPCIQVGTIKKDNDLVYFVKDNGVGFDMKNADKIFEPFVRLHSPREFSGTGIGLAIVRKIIERHHGKIWISSEKGKGTTVYFILNEQLEVFSR